MADIDAVTRESAIAAIEHVAQNNCGTRAHEAEGMLVAAPAAVAGPSDAETVDVVGVRANGAHVNLGKVAMPPRMKAREIAVEQFGGFENDDGSDAELCFWAMESFLDWLVAQGWTAAPTTQPAPQREALEPVAVPRFNCWTTNDGDSWFNHPADSQAIYDCLGDDAKVGEEYELIAGWISVTARYRITEVVGDGEEYEVECISHQQENTAPQPSPVAQGDALDAARYRWLREQHWDESQLFVVAGGQTRVKLSTDCPSLHRLDEAIDAARAAQAAKGGA